MAKRKKKVALWVDGQLADDLDALAGSYAGNKGDILAAALHLFLNAPKADQAAALKAALGIRVDVLFDLAPADDKAKRHAGFRAPLRKAGKPAPRK